ncbi:MAG TPA: GrpB family protein [Pyrinomonadaceae bacterium]|nr:GrpB family protein [Pyrinomonadaceae bacterium]
MLGLDRKSVLLVPHRKAWKTLFEREEKLLRSALGDYAAAIEHIGSTAIPDIAAKPIIDILVGVEAGDLSEVEKYLPPLARIGYEYRGEAGTAGRRYFRKGTAAAVSTHHLSIAERGGEIWRRHILFRDYLRAEPEAARAYAELKKNLAIKYKERREDYTDGKTGFVEEILLKAGFSGQK